MVATKRLDPVYDALCKKRAVESFKRNKKKAYAYRNGKRATDPQFLLAGRIRCRIGNVLKGSGTGKAFKTEEVVGCTFAELKAHIEKQFVAGMSWEKRSLWEIDHIQPCALYNLKDPAQQKLAFHYTNLKPIWKQDNRAKSDLLPDGTRARHRRVSALQIAA